MTHMYKIMMMVKILWFCQMTISLPGKIQKVTLLKNTMAGKLFSCIFKLKLSKHTSKLSVIQ